MPTKSGTIVQSRDQVRIGRVSNVFCCFSTLASNRMSTYGPFFSERLMFFVPLPRSGNRFFYESKSNSASRITHKDMYGGSSLRDPPYLNWWVSKTRPPYI